MIKIYKDNHEIEVSKNTYEMMFKPLGYKIKENKVNKFTKEKEKDKEKDKE